jgi:adenylylsulfate kinase
VIKLGSTLERSFLKGCMWEFISFIIAISIAYAFYHSWGSSIRFVLILTVIKVPLFFIHERIWKRIKWGKIKVKKKR